MNTDNADDDSLTPVLIGAVVYLVVTLVVYGLITWLVENVGRVVL